MNPGNTLNCFMTLKFMSILLKDRDGEAKFVVKQIEIASEDPARTFRHQKMLKKFAEKVSGKNVGSRVDIKV